MTHIKSALSLNLTLWSLAYVSENDDGGDGACDAHLDNGNAYDDSKGLTYFYQD